VIVDGADSKINLPAEELAQRRAYFANHRHVVVDHAGHAIPRHQPARVAELILDLAHAAADHAAPPAGGTERSPEPQAPDGAPDHPGDQTRGI